MTDITYVALDTETFPIGPGAILPRMVCVSLCQEGQQGYVLGNHPADNAEADLLSLFTPGNGAHIVMHNAAFDLGVLYEAYPSLRPLIWDKLEAREVHDTMLREQLLNLSTIGKLEAMTLPTGETKQLSYALAALVLKYLSIDISDSKSGTDAWRTNYDVLDGLKATEYPAAAYEYAALDAEYTMQVFQAQEEEVRSKDRHASLATETFHTAVSFSLMMVTKEGMATDPAAFARLQAMLDLELSDEQLRPIIEAGILIPATGATPYKTDLKKIKVLLEEWLGDSEASVEEAMRDPGLVQAMADAGIRFKAPQPSRVDTKALKAFFVAAAIERAKAIPMADSLAKFNGNVDLLFEEATRLDVKVPLTETKQVSTASAVLQTIAHQHPALENYQHRQKLTKLVSTEVPRMMWNGELAPVVHFPYKTLLETGRTSSHASTLYPSANGQNVDPRARGVYVPRPGRVLCSCDFQALELVCVAQTTFRLFGYSVHRDKIKKGYDLHAYLGSQLAAHLDRGFATEIAGMDDDEIYSHFRALEHDNLKERRDFYKKWRKMAKPFGLGFPGGLGPAKMVELATKDPYNVDVYGMAQERFESHPEEFDTSRVRYHAKRLYGWDENQIAWTRELLAIAFVGRLRDLWLNTYPEMAAYFKWVECQVDTEGEPFWPNPEAYHSYQDALQDWEEYGQTHNEPKPQPGDFGGDELLCYTTPMGMFRARATYTAVSNGCAMQSPGAEGAKWAILHVVRACLDPRQKSILLGCRVVNFVHDELILELDIDKAHEQALEVRRLMELGLAEIIKDVPVRAEACLMRRWSKMASPKFDETGRLIPDDSVEVS